MLTTDPILTKNPF